MKPIPKKGHQSQPLINICIYIYIWPLFFWPDVDTVDGGKILQTDGNYESMKNGLFYGITTCYDGILPLYHLVREIAYGIVAGVYHHCI